MKHFAVAGNKAVCYIGVEAKCFTDQKGGVMDQIQRQQMNLRVPGDLKTAISQASRENQRTLNAEAVMLMKEGLKWREQREKATA